MCIINVKNILLIITFLTFNGIVLSVVDKPYIFLKKILLNTIDTEIRHKLYRPLDELIQGHGYPFESHYLTTSDGYILNLHRIPHGRNGRKNNHKVAFLQHGILVSSVDWVLLGNKSLGCMLADEGYDVWMGNTRGNTYSRNHTSLNPDSDIQFWQFTWNEMGEMDVPEMIDYVLNVTSADGVYYVGHSQGTTAFYVMASQKPRYNDKVKVQVSLSPVAFMKYMRSPLFRAIGKIRHELDYAVDIIGLNEFLSNKGFVSKLFDSICLDESTIICRNLLYATLGYSPDHMNVSTISLMKAYSPAGASSKQFVHYAQEMDSGYFCKYDYGLKENLIRYGRFSPPSYDLSKIVTKVFLIFSGNDWLSSVKDVEHLYEKLPNAEKLRNLDFSYNHMDFVFADNAPEIVFKRVLNLLSHY